MAAPVYDFHVPVHKPGFCGTIFLQGVDTEILFRILPSLTHQVSAKKLRQFGEKAPPEQNLFDPPEQMRLPSVTSQAQHAAAAGMDPS
ncbi:hypothetical protein [Maricaulis sp.]|uniref:hypothetical protein n=1 Tax=Maricaulis sp. TaxID=1486257 RepID=UPI001B1BA3D6|nr:hypothetical protein [Maricaulis sp.]MBO6764497.1 hypothetical protein [Maricaulis sp.]